MTIDASSPADPTGCSQQNATSSDTSEAVGRRRRLLVRDVLRTEHERCAGQIRTAVF